MTPTLPATANVHDDPKSPAAVLWAQAAVLALLVLTVYWAPIQSLLVSRWLNDGNWSHGWLIPVFSAYFVYSRWGELRRYVVRPTYWGAVVLAGSLAMNFVFAWVIPMGYPQALSMLGTIFGAVLLVGGWRAAGALWFPIAFLAFAIPLPQRLYFEMTFPLRAWASTAAAALMPLFIDGLHTEAQTVVIDYIAPGGRVGQLNVEEACSGMRLMMAFVTLGVAMAYLGERPMWQRAIMVASCVPIALFCNTIRVTVTGLLTIHGRTDLAQGTPHQMLGVAMLLLALGLFSAIGYLLSHLFVEVADQAI
ncbi:MAG: exosortase/archaeosortase family protein [Planctomycetota bacterium]